MTVHFSLPLWYDLHTHMRQDALLPTTVKDHIAMACAGFLAMPNTKPPLTRVFTAEETPNAGSIETYRATLLSHATDQIQEIITPLYLCADTTPHMIEQGAKSGLLKAAKYYPPHGTTGAESGAPLHHYIDNGVIKALEDNNVTLCIHGEEHALEGHVYFDRLKNAETQFYENKVPRLLDTYPRLKLVGEHITTKTAVDLITQAPSHVKGSITPQHLLYTVGHLLQGLKYHLYCLPLLKFDDDRQALRTAVLTPNNTDFFAGTDSAPHTHKATPCGCAAGCYTGGIAPQLYAQAFEDAGADLSTPKDQKIFEAFLCSIGRDFYGLPIPKDRFTLEKTPQTIGMRQLDNGETLTPLPVGLVQQDTADLPWTLRL